MPVLDQHGGVAAHYAVLFAQDHVSLAVALDEPYDLDGPSGPACHRGGTAVVGAHRARLVGSGRTRMHVDVRAPGTPESAGDGEGLPVEAFAVPEHRRRHVDSS